MRTPMQHKYQPIRTSWALRVHRHERGMNGGDGSKSVIVERVVMICRLSVFQGVCVLHTRNEL
jgi:hypothetical protein